MTTDGFFSVRKFYKDSTSDYLQDEDLIYTILQNPYGETRIFLSNGEFITLKDEYLGHLAHSLLGIFIKYSEKIELKQKQ